MRFLGALYSLGRGQEPAIQLDHLSLSITTISARGIFELLAVLQSFHLIHRYYCSDRACFGNRRNASSIPVPQFLLGYMQHLTEWDGSHALLLLCDIVHRLESVHFFSLPFAFYGKTIVNKVNRDKPKRSKDLASVLHYPGSIRHFVMCTN